MANIDLSQQICTLEFQLDKLDKELERCRTNTRPVPDSYSINIYENQTIKEITQTLKVVA